MLIKQNYMLLAILLISIFTFACKKITTEPDEIIPLDGRGGGIISYCYQPLQSQDGRHQIYAINADGSGNKKLINASIGLNHHDWSPDGQKMVSVGYIGNTNSTWSIHTFNIDGTDLTRLTNQLGVWDTEPAWSPDGTKIVFTRIYPNQNNREELWIMDADGSNQNYIGIEGFAGKWSPDGTKFVYSSKNFENYEIFICNSDWTGVQQLTNTITNEMYVSWSPDGLKIAYTVYNLDFTSSNIYIMNTDGTDQQQLIDGNNADEYSKYSPDGSIIAFIRDLSEWELELFVVNSDGTNIRRVTNSPEGITAINPVWNPIL